MRRTRSSYPSPSVYRAVLVLRRAGRRVESYDRDRRLHVVDNAIMDEPMLVARAGQSTPAATRRR
ncbi:hypothetical protein HL658_07455 [Azospirillum sp. RWY-5-1]|uniref:Uncharacterized protein n=1 Tax=Azospirillum oleiclasticum TaxID=2735135 RepID=A0ABX2T664_9PROT|nr:hypothetical protein [Azospirillum oleiclasticum]NYZ12381.1 hypothetical protein [Azospirillum oleiclasticum]NYZ19542.1 hypothetical protein [Azospirillum oleiclasticum]